jgi:hypothetical protein
MAAGLQDHTKLKLLLEKAPLLSQKSRSDTVSFPNAADTALGHTLLHIACLPYRDEVISYTPKIQESIHETHSLHNTQFRRSSSDNVSYNGDGRKVCPPYHDQDGGPRDMPDELHRQDAICKRIVTELGSSVIERADSHGNTALHYLTGSWYLNESLIAWLRSWTPGEFAWQNHADSGVIPLETLWRRTSRYETFPSRPVVVALWYQEL